MKQQLIKEKLRYDNFINISSIFITLTFWSTTYNSFRFIDIIPNFFRESGTYTTEAVSRWIVQGADSITVISISMFILEGAITSKGGIAKKFFDGFA